MRSAKWWLEEGWPGSLAPYVLLLRALLQNRVSADEFVLLLSNVYLRDPTKWKESEYQLLDRLFAAADDFEGDQEGRSPDLPHRPDEKELRVLAELTLNGLRRVAFDGMET